MAPDELDDPGASTAMFQAYVEEGRAAPERTSTPLVIGLVVAIVVLAAIGLVLLLG